MPSRLSHILGQEQVVRVLRRALAANRVAQAYLFAGPVGVGKASCARALAAALNCREEPGEGCGRCTSCDKIERDLHPDFKVLSPTGAYIKVDQVRVLEEQLSYRPHEGRYRLVLVDGAEHLYSSAANALLKSVEEPRPGTIFVLVTSAAHRVIPTLISRCQRLRFSPLERDIVEQILAREQPDLDPEDLRAAAEFCEGSVGRALDLAQGERIATLRGIADKLLAAARRGRVVEIFEAATGAGRDRAVLVEALDLLRLNLRRDLLGGDGGEAGAAAGDLDRVLARLRAVDRAQAALRGNVSPALALENLALGYAGSATGHS